MSGLKMKVRESLVKQAAFRRQKAKAFPQDRRNAQCAATLEHLAATIDDVPDDLWRELGQALVFDPEETQWAAHVRHAPFHRTFMNAEDWIIVFLEQNAAEQPEAL